MRSLCRGFLLALLVLIAAPALGTTTTHIAASLVAERGAPPGGETTLAIVMKPAAGWHGYWVNPGDAGLGLALDWRLPRGMSAGALRYPVPQTLLIGGLMNHVFERDYAVLVPARIPATAKTGDRLAIRVKARWLACTEEVCVPEEADLTTELPVGPAPRDPRFDAWRAALPAPLGAAAHVALAGGMVRLGIPLPATVTLQDPHFFAADNGVIDYAARQAFSRRGDWLIVELTRTTIAPVAVTAFAGVLRLNRASDGLTIAAVPGMVPPAGDPVEAKGAASLPALLLAALLGGLLLNVMPCVFPILSLKALSLARAGESEVAARAEGLAYTAGVVLACVVLGGLLLALRAGGEQVGWAFQLQEPAVVVLLTLLAVAISANLAGLYEFAIPGFARGGSRQGGVLGAFATGLLAAFVATPCTGPFMAAAMGAALLLPLAPALLLFAALGLGLALPFLALAFVPALRRRLPKPGAWMERFRKVLAVPMALTALALLWLSWKLGGIGFAAIVTALAVAVVAVLAAAGIKQRGGLALGSPLIASLAVLILVGPVLLHFYPAKSAVAEAGLLDAKPFSEAALARARADGKPVFAWFTADWCLTCKVNENVAIEREATRAAFAKAGVVVLRGDWTRRDPAITRYLTAQGAAGVPLYVWYPAGGGAPRQLPQVLTPALLAGLAR